MRKKLQLDPNRDTKDFRDADVTRFYIIRGILRIVDGIDYQTCHRLRTYIDSGGNIREVSRRLGFKYESAIRRKIDRVVSKFKALMKASAS